MKRWPLIASFVLFIALCVSAAYWGMQLFKPPARAVAAPPPTVQPPPRLDAAAALFGGRSNVAVATNFQLRGVVMSGNPNESVAILAADGKPAQAVRANTEIMPGVRVQEVHARYVLLFDNGATKRVELPEEGSPLARVDTVVSPVPRAVPPLPAATPQPAAVPPRPTVTPLSPPFPTPPRTTGQPTPQTPYSPQPQASAPWPPQSSGNATPPFTPGTSGASGVQGAQQGVAQGVPQPPGPAPQMPPPVFNQVPTDGQAAPGMGTPVPGTR